MCTMYDRFVNITKPELQVHHQPCSCVCDISVNIYIYIYILVYMLFTYGYFDYLA